MLLRVLLRELRSRNSSVFGFDAFGDHLYDLIRVLFRTLQPAVLLRGSPPTRPTNHLPIALDGYFKWRSPTRVTLLSIRWTFISFPFCTAKVTITTVKLLIGRYVPRRLPRFCVTCLVKRHGACLCSSKLTTKTDV